MPRKSVATRRTRHGSQTPRRRGQRAGRTRARSTITTSHDEIRKWAEERGGKPARVKGTGRRTGDTGMIRLEFPRYSQSRDESLEEIGWDDFFDEFDKKNLALTYQERTAVGDLSNFNKLISRRTGTARRSSRRKRR